MSAQVGSGHIAIFPVMKGFKSRVSRDVKSAGRAGARDFEASMKGAGRAAGDRVGRGLKSGVDASAGDLGAKALKGMNREVASASAGLSKARRKQQDEAGKVRVAEARLAEAIEKTGAGSARTIAAEERLAKARRQHKVATDAVSSATARLKGAQEALSAATKASTTASSKGFTQFKRNVKDALAPVTSLGSAVKDMASRAIGPAVSKFRDFASSAISPVRRGLEDLALKGAYKASSALVNVSKSASSFLAPALEKLSPITSVLGRSFSGFAGLAKQAFGGLAPVVKSTLSGLITTARELGSRAGQALADGIRNTATAAVTVASTAIAVALGTGFKRLTSLDTARAKLVGLGHDGKTVASIMKDSTAAVKGTAFGLDEAATVAAGAVAAGIKPGQQLEGTLKGVANVAAATNRTMEETGSIFNNVRANQAAYTEDIKQLANAGLPIWDALQKATGKTQEEVRKMATKGEIDFDTFAKAAADAAGTVADEMGSTVPASIKNMFASISRIGANIFGGINEETGEMYGLYARLAPLIQSVTGVLGPLEGRAKSWGESLDKTIGPAIEWVTDLFERLAGGSDGLSSMFSGLAPLLAPVGAAFAAIGSGGLASLLSRIPLLGGMLGGLTGPLAALGGPLGIAAAAIAGFALSGSDASGMVEALTGIVEQVVEALPGMIDQVVEFIPGLVDSILEQAPALFEAATGIVTVLIEGLVEALPLLIGGGVQLIQGLIQAVVENLPMIIEGALLLVTALLRGIVEALPLIIEGGIELLMALITGIIEALPMLIESALTLLTWLIGALIDNLPMIIEAGIELLLALVNGLINALPQLIETAITLVLQLVAGLLKMLPQLIVAGIELIVALIVGLVQAIPQIIAMLPQIVSAIWNGLKGVDWAGLGMDIVWGIINGLASMGGALVDAIVNLASAAFDGFKSFFGIASPAKRMMQPGRDVVRGAVGGVDDEASSFGDALVSMARSGTRRAEAALSRSMEVAGSRPGVGSSATGVAGGGDHVSVKQEIRTNNPFAAARAAAEYLRGGFYAGDDFERGDR